MLSQTTKAVHLRCNRTLQVRQVSAKYRKAGIMPLPGHLLFRDIFRVAIPIRVGAAIERSCRILSSCVIPAQQLMVTMFLVKL